MESVCWCRLVNNFHSLPDDIKVHQFEAFCHEHVLLLFPAYEVQVGYCFNNCGFWCDGIQSVNYILVIVWLWFISYNGLNTGSVNRTFWGRRFLEGND